MEKGTRLVGCIFFAPFIICGAVFPIVGIVLVIIGTSLEVKMNNNTQDYVETIGYYKNSTYVSTNDEGSKLYKLNYEYIAYGETYLVSTNYSTNSIPKIGEEETIKYNPRNPNEAVITSKTIYGTLILIGILFVILPFSWILPIVIIAIISKFKNTGKVKKNNEEYQKSKDNKVLTVRELEDNDNDDPIKNL